MAAVLAAVVGVCVGIAAMKIWSWWRNEEDRNKQDRNEQDQNEQNDGQNSCEAMDFTVEQSGVVLGAVSVKVRARVTLGFAMKEAERILCNILCSILCSLLCMSAVMLRRWFERFFCSNKEAGLDRAEPELRRSGCSEQVGGPHMT